MWENYKDINSDSNIDSYQIAENYIEIKFRRTYDVYKYSYSSAGKNNVEKMKELARCGDGLNSYIMCNCKKLYEK